jgi:hypothetical protein
MVAERPLVALFDYPDVFEDFYVHYGVTQNEFAISWAETATHKFASLIQSAIGDVTWYEFSLSPELETGVNTETGNTVRFV